MIKVTNDRIKWFAYIHVDGGIKIKRYFDARDFIDACESDFVAEVMPSFYAETRGEAEAKANEFFL
jgi:hypothetical protein